MFKRKKKNGEPAVDRDGEAPDTPEVSEDNPMFGGAAVDNHRDDVQDSQEGEGLEGQPGPDEGAPVSAEGPDAPEQPVSNDAGAPAHSEASTGASPAPDDERPATGEEWREGKAEDFARPRAFEVKADDVPLREDDREEVSGMPFDADGAFAHDADIEEFQTGGSDSFLDDEQRDYYRYGDKMHGVRQTAEDEEYEEEQAAEQALHAQEEVDDEFAAKEAHAASPARARHRKPTKKEQLEAAPEHVRKSHRTRRVLIVVVILLVALLAAIGYWAVSLYQVNNDTAVQQVDSTTTDVDAVSSGSDATSDSSNENAKTTEVPQLVSLMGLTQDDAITTLGHGATATVSTAVSEEGNPVTTSVTVLLTDEPADSKSGTPTVYLGLNADGTVVQAGYSAATASLGYGNLSFGDAITNEHVVENTLDDAGLNVEPGTVELPSDKLSYTSYASDGKTVTSERCSFDGTSTVGDANYTWSAVLSYDYTAANASGNLADTVRQITVYINQA